MWGKRSGWDVLALYMVLKSSSLMHTPPPPEQQQRPTGTLEGPCGMGPSSGEDSRLPMLDCGSHLVSRRQEPVSQACTAQLGQLAYP